jgi:hypothetical protein
VSGTARMLALCELGVVLAILAMLCWLLADTHRQLQERMRTRANLAEDGLDVFDDPD